MGSSRHTNGFTIVELIIVIIVIAILATITTISYNSVSRRTTEASMQSDLRTSESVLETYRRENGVYPSDASILNGGKGLSVSGANQLTYVNLPFTKAYCVSVTNPKTTTQFKINSGSSEVASGVCVDAGGAGVTTLAGASYGYADGTGVASQFASPYDVAVDSTGILYVADRANGVVRKVTQAGVVTTLAGTAGSFGSADGTRAAARFNMPVGIAVDTTGNLYVTDYGNHRIRMVTATGAVTTVAGSSSGSANGAGAAAQFNGPIGIAVDNGGTVYVADYGNNRIRKMTPSGDVSTLAGSTSGFINGTGTAAQFKGPYGVAVDSAGVVYVADTFNNSIRKVTPSGVVTTLAGAAAAGWVDSTGTAARFNAPQDITIDSSGTLYVADTGNHRIRKITPAGVVTTLVGSTAGSANGSIGTAQLNYPYGVAVDAAGTVYVADYGNNRIRKIQ